MEAKKLDRTGLIKMDLVVQSGFLAFTFFVGLMNSSSLQTISFYIGLNAYQLITSLLDRGTITPLAYLKGYWIIEGCCLFFFLIALGGSFGSILFVSVLIPIAVIYYYALTINNYVKTKK